MTPGVIADRRQKSRRIADVGEHERTHGRLGGSTRARLRRSLAKLLPESTCFGRRSDAYLRLQPTSKLGIDLEGLGEIATSAQGQHEIPITTLAQRLTFDDQSCRALRGE